MSGAAFEQAVRHSRAFALIARDIEEGAGHAYAVISPDDDAVSSLFTLVACRTFCLNGSGCGVCSECRRVTGHNHPDVVTLNSAREKIKVGDIKEMISDVGIKALSGEKYYFIERADLMSADAQNKLLKTLEEPPRGVHFFLGAANEAGLLGTVRSRCRTIYMDAFDTDTVERELIAAGTDKRSAQVAAACSEGSLTKAKAIASSKEYAAVYDAVLAMLSGMKRSPDVAAFDSNPEIVKHTEIYLDVMSVILSDVIRAHYRPETIVSKHVKDKIIPLTASYSAAAAAKITEIINEERAKLSLNVNKTAVIDHLLFSVLEVRYKWQ